METVVISEGGADEAEIRQIRHALKGLQFGTVTVIVQDGVVVQIDRTERHRVRRKEAQAPRETRRPTS